MEAFGTLGIRWECPAKHVTNVYLTSKNFMCRIGLHKKELYKPHRKIIPKHLDIVTKMLEIF